MDRRKMSSCLKGIVSSESLVEDQSRIMRGKTMPTYGESLILDLGV